MLRGGIAPQLSSNNLIVTQLISGTQDPSGYGGRDDPAYLGTAPAAGVGGRAASPDPKTGVNRARSSSPNAAAAALPHQHQSLEHAMQTKLTIGERVAR